MFLNCGIKNNFNANQTLKFHLYILYNVVLQPNSIFKFVLPVFFKTPQTIPAIFTVLRAILHAVYKFHVRSHIKKNVLGNTSFAITI